MPWLKIGSTAALLLGAGSCWAYSGLNEHTWSGVSLPMCLLEHRGAGPLVAHFGKGEVGGTVDEAGEPLNAVGGQSFAQRLDDRYAAGDGGFKGHHQTFSKDLVAALGDRGVERNQVANKASDGRGINHQRNNLPKAPEVDAGAAGGALALLVSGLLLASEKRRRPLQA